MRRPGCRPGRCHWPKNEEVYSEEYFRQLTAEKCVTRYVKGFPKREWVKTRPRNEALDCRVYAHVALLIINPNFKRHESRLNAKAVEVEETSSTPQETSSPQKRPKAKKRKRTKKKRRRSGFVNG